MLESYAYACQWHNDFELLTLSDMVPGLETVLTVLMRRLSKYSPSDSQGVFGRRLRLTMPGCVSLEHATH